MAPRATPVQDIQSPIKGSDSPNSKKENQLVGVAGYKPPSAKAAEPSTVAATDNPDASVHVDAFDGIQPLDMTQYPQCCVGKVICGGGIPGDMVITDKVGTGVLVHPNIVISASHILPWNHDPPLVRFIPGYSAGSEPFGHFDTFKFANLPAQSQLGQSPTGIDIGLVFLDQSPGDNLGWFGWQSNGSEDWYKGNWTSVGYPTENFGGERAIAWGVNITDVNEDNEASGTDFELISPGYASAPWVGAPLWHLGSDLLPYLGGVVSGNRDGRTVHAGGPLMASWLRSHSMT